MSLKFLVLLLAFCASLFPQVHPDDAQKAAGTCDVDALLAKIQATVDRGKEKLAERRNVFDKTAKKALEIIKKRVPDDDSPNAIRASQCVENIKAKTVSSLESILEDLSDSVKTCEALRKEYIECGKLSNILEIFCKTKAKSKIAYQTIKLPVSLVVKVANGVWRVGIAITSIWKCIQLV